MHIKKLTEVYFTEDGIVDGPEVTQCRNIGGSHWTQNPIELYSLVSDGEVTEHTTPYHVHFYMPKEKARANWHKLTPGAKARILQCTTVSFEMPAEWHQWEAAYLSVLYAPENDPINYKNTWGTIDFHQDELVKYWLSGACPESIANLMVSKRSYAPHYQWRFRTR